MTGASTGYISRALCDIFSLTFPCAKLPLTPHHTMLCIAIAIAILRIGRHAAEALANRGYVVLAGVRKEADAQSITDMEIKTLVPVYLDVTNEQACIAIMKKVAEMTAKTALPFVALVNNAGG